MVPDAYYKDIFKINYDNLKRSGIKNIFLDVDNTIVPYKEDLPSDEMISFINKLKKDFNIVIVSNSMSNRVVRIVKSLDVKGYYTSMKPLKKTYKKIEKEYKKNESVFIGDQFMTDVLGAKRMKFRIILVDRLQEYEPLVTKFWRFFEGIILKDFKKKGIFEKNNYYDKIK